MQEVFKKIIEKLEEKALEHGINGQQLEEDGCISLSNEEYAKRDGLYDAIEIVNQSAAEYNNGWIPCSSGKLPEEKEQERTKYDPITLAEMDVERFMESELVNVTVKDYDRDEVFACDDCTVDGKWVNFNCYPYEVIAWRKLPEPYQPNICTADDCPINDGNECPAADGCAGYHPKGE